MSRIFRTAAAVALSASVAVGAAQAKSSFAVLHAFAGAPGDGDRPKDDLAFDGAGNLYGTTYDGGASDNGAIFKIDTHGTATLLHSFDGSAGGALPASGVTIDDKTGDLYGVTQGGGAGAGTLYKLAADGTFTVLHTFANSTSDGGFPQWRLIRDKKGNLFGVANSGGTHGYGTLFEYARKGGYSTVYDFDLSASGPTGRLALDGKGNLYGVTGTGGTSTSCSGHGCGSIYELTPDGTLATLYSFGDGNDGRYPVGGLTIDEKGNLYGTTGYGGAGDAGTVFELSKDRQFATLFSFDNTNGNSPVDEVLLLKKDLYLTVYGGGANGIGTVVKVSLKGTGKVLHDFADADGALPIGGLVENDGLLYGTTSSRGADGHGTVFSIKAK